MEKHKEASGAGPNQLQLILGSSPEELFGIFRTPQWEELLPAELDKSTWKIGDSLNHDSSVGTVHKGKTKGSGEPVFIRVIYKDKVDLVALKREITLMSLLSTTTSNMVQFIGHAEVQNTMQGPPKASVEAMHLIVTAWVPLNLQFLLFGGPSQIPDHTQLRYIALDIANFMEKLHSFEIAHGNLKLTKVLLRQEPVETPRSSPAAAAAAWFAPPKPPGDEPDAPQESKPAAPARKYKVYISDFGGYKRGNGNESITKARRSQAPPRHIAPELVEGETIRSATKDSDVYSFGVILWEIFTPADEWEGRNIMQEALSTKPEERPSFKQIVELLSKSLV